MSSRIYNTPLAALVPESIRTDTTIRAAADGLDPALGSLVRGVPDLLLFSRLDPSPGTLSPVMQRLTDSAGGLKALSEPELELLAWQLHVDFREVARTREQLAEMVRRSIPWHRIKGTPASIRAALALFGQSATIEEDGVGKHWATYQLGLPEIADLDTVRLVYRVAREMAPVRCRLWRMYSGYDRRPVIWSGGTEHDRWSEGWWTYYSGVSVPGITEDDENDLLVSFGVRNAYQIDAFIDDSICCSFGTTSVWGTHAPYIDHPVWSRSNWGDQYPQNHGFVIGSLFSILWCERATVARSWQGEWDNRRWADYTGFDRQLPRWKMGVRNFSKSQSVYSESDNWGDINSCYSRPVTTILNAPPVWGEARWSEDALRPREIVVHEMTIVPVGLTVPPLNPGDPGTGMASRLSVATGTPGPARVLMDGLHELAVAALPVDSPPAHTARTETLTTRSTPPNLPAPSAAVTTYQAPQWVGAWADPDRAWNTSPKIALQ